MIRRSVHVPLLALLAAAILALPQEASAKKSIVDSKHNLSVSGPGQVKASSEDRICIFCHTPHNATPNTPLWNRSIDEGTNYDLYDSTTFNVALTVPTGPSRLCLSCHDGTIGIGAVLMGGEGPISGGVTMNMELTGRPSLLGTDLRNDHPFSFSYQESMPNNELNPSPPPEIPLYVQDTIHCSTCHDPHDDTFGMFLVVDNTGSALCIKCHVIPGWSSSSHATDLSTWNNTAPDPWPLNDRLAAAFQRHNVKDNGCENCHTPHNAGGAQRLLHYLKEEENCTYACHNGNVGSTDIKSQLNKVAISGHPVTMTEIGQSVEAHDPTEDVRSITGHVECQDCHDPHTVDNSAATVDGGVSGKLGTVSGVDQNWVEVYPATYEYQICFKCHADTNTMLPDVDRWLKTVNTRLSFATTNSSYHPVVGIGKNSNVPSLVSSTSLDTTLNESSRISCTDCHDSDDTTKISAQNAGPNGPHGSMYKPLLRENYERTLGNSESYFAYALCYRCHERSLTGGILTDVSFRKSSANLGGHSGHIGTNRIPCSACHDPHGVADDPGFGSQTNLMNFDSTIVSPASGQIKPIFNDTGSFSGNCLLICHMPGNVNVIHDGSATYSYP